jgi:integrase
LRRELGVAPERKRPLLAEDLRKMLLDLPDSKLGKRDRALLSLGFTGAFRRSELVALDVSDLEGPREGLIVTIRKSKTDQEG